MNGMSDVRLILRSQELENGRAISIQMSCPPNLSRWGVWRHRWITRKALVELTKDQLRDIGITHEQARVEGLKPFWRV
ncbi:MAG: putative conserved small protein [Pseudomonas sp.]|nr:putative conserved small protein [Pseudomonas sp.]